MNTRKYALVTGANKGIGLEIARQLAGDGFTVFIGGRDPVATESAADRLVKEGFEVIALPLDVTNASSIAAAVDRVSAITAKLDALINNAGILRDGASSATEFSVSEMRTTYETNVFGPVAVLQAFLPLLRAASAARVVNVSSALGSLSFLSDPLWEHANFKGLGYCSSKAALNAVTVLMAAALRGTSIKVNSACPGFCATDLNGFSGHRTPTDGARISVKLATLPSDGPSGGFFRDEGHVPW